MFSKSFKIFVLKMVPVLLLCFSSSLVVGLCSNDRLVLSSCFQIQTVFFALKGRPDLPGGGALRQILEFHHLGEFCADKFSLVDKLEIWKK